MKFTLWNKQDPILFPFCKLDAQGVFTHYPWAQDTDAVMEWEGDVCVGFSALSTVLAGLGLDVSLTGDAALAAIAQAEEARLAAQQSAQQAQQEAAETPLATQDDVLAVMEGIAALYELNAGGNV